jgi:uncharacterized protein with HEPN domain
VRKDARYLDDMIEAIERIERYTASGSQVIEQDELISTWVLHHLQIIGEAARALSEPLKQAHPEVAWRRITDFRNVLVHEYFGVDMVIIRAIVDRDLRDLKTNVAAIARTVERED